MTQHSPTRRAALRTACWIALAGVGRLAAAHNQAGTVSPPRGAPEMKLVTHTARQTTLRALLTGKATALQLMFTGCSATCPIQGALFAQVQAALPRAGRLPLQLVSASIDPFGDTPRAMQGWLAKFGAESAWTGMIPEAGRVDAWLDFLNGRAVGSDRHTGQVFFFDEQARLVLRTADFPKSDEVARLLAQLASRIKV
ncbi:SCO family protein [Burkholderia sp. FERM BP-3421]|jgi:protein SCO1/2|uniref:SCO family protein n=1 Tax=Burkholderia sp. FERM BP-3421 TaxID=1494466 RepID=UPI0023620A13|nr:SCO family protein [Burkholderia sp. FERM BP-3421]WDD92879.1 SCO family protein [Burkholderia sp. FERM BP-3421]